ncbi:type II toxin-antitoxin system HigB family toxin [Leptospira idonii]|uniref:Type II toxin-antitoxin system HigB family toxin n=1 Tax=Leptospira idonii TaxID=1193500 RepID=A0A4R9M004_9LEPT|nr:type II toxin-antitoxin system HigB family toxin [Leptospira idonii]
MVKNTNFNDFNDLRKVFNSVDQVGKFTVFNISGNHFRLIAAIHFNRKKVFIRHILTHSEYDKGKWKKENL